MSTVSVCVGSWPLLSWGGAFLGSKARLPDTSRLMPESSVLPLDEFGGESGEGSAISAQSSSERSSTQHSSIQHSSSASRRATESPSNVLDFEEVYQAHFAFVWRLARRQGVPLEHVDDVCQEVFIVVHRRLSEFEERAKVRTWIYQIVANVVRNQRRSVQRKSVYAKSQGNVVDPDELDSHTVSPEMTTGRKEAAQAAREILMSMNESQRMAFVLVELEGMTVKEAAEATEESFHTIRSRLRSARAEFQRHARRFRNVAEWGPNG